MQEQWYYAHEEDRLGPFTDRELKDLAASGDILPSATIWKEGIKQGVPASDVGNLFQKKEAPPQEPLDEVEPSSSEDELVEPEPEEVMAKKEPEPAPVAYHQRVKEKKTKAIAVKGAIIMSQDGTYARYKKKCVKCGHEDTCTSRMPIRIGTNSMTFFCPKCRKLQPVELRGSVTSQ